MLLTAQRTARAAPERLTPFQQWAVKVAAKRGHNIAAIAVAYKLARIVWAVWHRDVDFETVAAARSAA